MKVECVEGGVEVVILCNPGTECLQIRRCQDLNHIWSSVLCSFKLWMVKLSPLEPLRLASTARGCTSKRYPPLHKKPHQKRLFSHIKLGFHNTFGRRSKRPEVHPLVLSTSNARV